MIKPVFMENDVQKNDLKKPQQLTEYSETYLGADFDHLNKYFDKKKYYYDTKNKGKVIFAQTSPLLSDRSPKLFAATESIPVQKRPNGGKCLALLSSNFLGLGDKV